MIVESLNKASQSNISDPEIIRKVMISQNNIKEREYNFDLDIPDNATVDLIITTNNKELDLKLTDNNVPITKFKRISFNEAIWSVYIVSLPSGIHKISGTSSAVLTSEDILKFQIRAKYPSLRETYDIN